MCVFRLVILQTVSYRVLVCGLAIWDWAVEKVVDKWESGGDLLGVGVVEKWMG